MAFVPSGLRVVPDTRVPAWQPISRLSFEADTACSGLVFSRAGQRLSRAIEVFFVLCSRDRSRSWWLFAQAVGSRGAAIVRIELHGGGPELSLRGHLALDLLLISILATETDSAASACTLLTALNFLLGSYLGLGRGLSSSSSFAGADFIFVSGFGPTASVVAVGRRRT